MTHRILFAISMMAFAACTHAKIDSASVGSHGLNIDLEKYRLPPDSEIRRIAGDCFFPSWGIDYRNITLKHSYYSAALKEFRQPFEVDTSPDYELIEYVCIVLETQNGRRFRISTFGPINDVRNSGPSRFYFSINGVRFRSIDAIVNRSEGDLESYDYATLYGYLIDSTPLFHGVGKEEFVKQQMGFVAE